MEVDEEMEVELVFEALEIDIEYEYEAAMFFDLTREETQDEAREAEIWFESAKSYPPSPFVKELVLREDIVMENVNMSPKLNRQNPSSSFYAGCQVGGSQEFCGKDVNNRDCEVMETGMFGNLQKVLNQPNGKSTGDQSRNAFSEQKIYLLPADLITEGLYNYFSTIKSKGKIYPSSKSSLPRSSTLMKPTASQLAKQNRNPQVGSSRLQMPLVQNNEKSLCRSSGVENQAPKRQKLEGGHLRKVNDGKQQTNFVHKFPKKDDTGDKISAQSKLKLTIPRTPELETAHRAQRIKPRDGKEIEQVKSTVRRFKARPFNKKIFEAPTLPLPKRSTPKLPEFQLFHLKTMERAKQNAPTVSFSNLCLESDKELDKPSTSTSTYTEHRNRESRRPSTAEVLQPDGDGVHRFKALPLNKKIFSSKGDIGIFRNSKRETTVPMEFNFHSNRKIQQNLPTDLFSKLSLTSELQLNSESQIRLPRSNFLSVKGSKENRSHSFQPENKMTENPSAFSQKQAACGSDRGICEISNKIHSRSWGVRWE